MTDSPSSDPREEPAIGWVRALATGLVILAVGVGLVVVGPNLLLTRLTSGRSTRVGLASTLAIAGTLFMAWALRRLQAKGWI